MSSKVNIFKIIKNGTIAELEQYIHDHPETLESKASWFNDYTTPLLYAIRSGDAQALRLLISAGADLKAQDSSGWPVLHNAVFWEREECIKILLEAGVDINEQDCKGFTALHVAAKYRKKAFVKILLDANINTTLQTNNGNTAECITTSREIDAMIVNARNEKETSAALPASPPPTGKFIKEGDYLVSITEVAPTSNINETIMYNFDTETVLYRDNTNGQSLRHSFDEAKSKKQLKAVASFLTQEGGNLCGFKLPAII